MIFLPTSKKGLHRSDNKVDIKKKTLLPAKNVLNNALTNSRWMISAAVFLYLFANYMFSY